MHQRSRICIASDSVMSLTVQSRIISVRYAASEPSIAKSSSLLIHTCLICQSMWLRAWDTLTMFEATVCGRS